MTKLKDILSEIKWEGKDIELGKIYTAKTMPPFKVTEDLKEGLGLIVIGYGADTVPVPHELLPITVKFPETSVNPNEIEIELLGVVTVLPFGKVQI